MVAIPIVVESVRAYCPGVPPEWSAAARRTAFSSSNPSSRVPSVSSASRPRWKSIAASTWAVCGESTKAANCAIAGSSGNCARTDSQSVSSKSGIVGAVAAAEALGDAESVAAVAEPVGEGVGVGSAAGASASQAVRPAATETDARPAPRRVRRVGAGTRTSCGSAPSPTSM